MFGSRFFVADGEFVLNEIDNWNRGGLVAKALFGRCWCWNVYWEVIVFVFRSIISKVKSHLIEYHENKILIRVCELCYRRLNLLLIAVQVSKSNGGQQLLINPGSHVKLKPGCLGFFIAESAKEVKRANVWCARCHANVTDPEDIRRCGCPHNVKVNATSHLDPHEVN